MNVAEVAEVEIWAAQAEFSGVRQTGMEVLRVWDSLGRTWLAR